MKKKLLLLPVMMMALAACGEEPSASVSVPDSTEASVDVSTPTSSAPSVENISAQALRSLMGSLTITGDIVTEYEGYSETDEITFSSKIEDGAISATFTMDGETDSFAYFDYQGYASVYYLSASNEVKQQVLVDQQNQPIAYPYTLLEQASYVSVANVVKMENGKFDVTNQYLRNAIALVVSGTYYYGIDGDIETMHLTVTDNVVTGVEFETEVYAYETMFGAINMKDSYSVTLSDHGTTTVEHGLTPYATYEEAAALNALLDKIGVAASISIDVDLNKSNYIDVQAVMSEDINYFEGLVYGETEEDNQSMSYGSVPFTYGTQTLGAAFVVDAEGKMVADGFDEYAPTSYALSYVAAEMFEFKDGKYSPRNEGDMSIVMPYVSLIGDIAPDTLTLEIKSATQLEIVFELTQSGIDYTTNQYIETNLKCVMVVDALDSAVTPVDSQVAGFVDLLTKFVSLPQDALGVWYNATSGKTVSIDYGKVLVDGQMMSVTSIEGTVITGTLDGQAVVITYVPAPSQNESDRVTIKVGDATPEVLSFDMLNYGAEYLGFAPNIFPPILNAELAMFDTTDLSYGLLYIAYIGENATQAYVDSYVEALLASGEFVDVSDYSASDFLQGATDQSMSEYFGGGYVLVETATEYGFVIVQFSQLTDGTNNFDAIVITLWY